MATSLDNKGFDAEAFLEGYPNPGKKSQDRFKRWSLYKEYSLPWNFEDGTPFPDMELNSSNLTWEPIDIDEFIPKHGEEFKKFKASLEANPSKKPIVSTSSHRRKMPSAVKTKQEEKIPAEKQDEIDGLATEVESLPSTTDEQYRGISDSTPSSDEESERHSDDKSNNEEKPSSEMSDDYTTKTYPLEDATVTEATKAIITDTIVETDIGDEGKKTVVRATRLSAKMRRASRAEFHDTYLIKTPTKGGKPITIAPDLIERAYRICIRSGDYKACPTYLFNNLLREVLDLIEPDTEAWAALD